MKEKVQHGNLKNNFMFKKCLLFTLTFFSFFSCADKKHEIKQEQKDTKKQEEDLIEKENLSKLVVVL